MVSRFFRNIVAWVALAMLVVGCADHISRPELLARIKSDLPPRLVDVRSSREFNEARAPGAVHVSFYSLLFHLDRIPDTRGADRPLILYCEHGPRAGLARAQLWLAGEGPVLFMEGHMTAWKQDGLPVETGDPSE